MFVVIAVASLNEGEAWQRVVGQICVVGRQRGDVVGINAERVRSISNRAGLHSGGRTGASTRILMQVLK